MTRNWIAIATLAAAACQAPVEPPAQNETAETLRGCEEALRLLRQMAAAEPRFGFDVQGNAQIPKALWQSLPPEMQDGLIKAIAYQAICAANEVRDQPVTVRASENYEVLAEQTVIDFAR